MRRTLIILLLLISTIASATKYYVAPSGGNDSNPGTIGSPWATWTKALTSRAAGDTVYFRGGVYMSTVTNGLGYSGTLNGTVSDTICFFAYPGEVPILDFNNVTSATNGHNYGVRLYGSYYHLRGLHFRNVYQFSGTDECDIISVYGDHVVIENCVAYQSNGVGFASGDDHEMYFINCDAHHNCDSLTTNLPGNDGYGFNIWNNTDNTSTTYYIGCRSWMNGDDGWAGYNIGYMEYDNCWSFRNGLLYGEGHGFKLGYVSVASWGLQRYIHNCISVYNMADGITFNDNGTRAFSAHVYNNSLYGNGTDGGGYGIIIYNTSSTDTEEYKRIMRNNLAYGNAGPYQGTQIYVGASGVYTHSNNTWDLSVTVSNADFVSVDSTGLTGARQADGSLPSLNFLKLASTSDLINAGTDVSIDYEGAAPDLGAYEYSSFEEEPSAPYIATTTPYAITANSAKTGGYMISDGGGTISAKGVCWGTSANPDLTDTVISGGTGTDDFTVTISGLVIKTTYHVRAYATNEVGTTYGADEEFTTSQSSIIKHGGKIVKR